MTAARDWRAGSGADGVRSSLDRAFVRVAGPDAETYLQGQLSQDVAAGARRADASCSSRPARCARCCGRSAPATTTFLLDTDAAAGDAVVARLRRFLLRTKADGRAGRARAASGSSARPRCRRRGSPAAWPAADDAPVDVVGSTAEAPPGHGDARPPRATSGCASSPACPCAASTSAPTRSPPRPGAWAIEAAVSFTKGCYTGQELVARIDSRGGNVPRPLRVLQSADGASMPPVADVLDDDGAGRRPHHQRRGRRRPRARSPARSSRARRCGSATARPPSSSGEPADESDWLREHRAPRSASCRRSLVGLALLVAAGAQRRHRRRCPDYEVPEGFEPAPPPTTAPPGGALPDAARRRRHDDDARSRPTSGAPASSGVVDGPAGRRARRRRAARAGRRRRHPGARRRHRARRPLRRCPASAAAATACGRSCAPTLAQATGDVFFLPDGEERDRRPHRRGVRRADRRDRGRPRPAAARPGGEPRRAGSPAGSSTPTASCARSRSSAASVERVGERRLGAAVADHVLDRRQRPGALRVRVPVDGADAAAR